MQQANQRKSSTLLEPAYDGWFGDISDQWYEELLDETKGPYRPMQLLLDTFPELSERKRSEITILDAACGTGNNYIAFSRHGYNIWATDGSWKMLEHAASNCKEVGVSDIQLIRKPTTWTDTEAYRQHFAEIDISFDVILVNSNSLCHIPAVSGYMDVALSNFGSLLKPGGRLIVDTKRFGEPDMSGSIPIVRELRHVEGKWVVRDERFDGRRLIDGWGEVEFRTKMHYDIDPVFGVCRARVEVTISGDKFGSQVRFLSYYPLPAATLIGWLAATRIFDSELHAAKSLPLDWSYDIVVARKIPI